MWNRDPEQGGAARHLRYRYFSPRWLYMLDTMADVFAWILFFLLLMIGGQALVFGNPFGLTGQERVVATGTVLGLARLVAKVSARWLAGFRGGFGLMPNGSHTLIAVFGPERISLRVGLHRISFDPAEPHQFMMREHPDRFDESRAEERARAEGMEQQPDYFRRAFELVLDRGVKRNRIAEVASEEQARDLLRRLQELDAYARGCSGAGVLLRTPTQIAATPLPRVSLDG